MFPVFFQRYGGGAIDALLPFFMFYFLFSSPTNSFLKGATLKGKNLLQDKQNLLLRVNPE